jgi:hypothetical protein
MEMKNKYFYQLIIALLIFASCEPSKSDNKLLIDNYQKKADSLNLIVSQLKSNCNYNIQYRYLLRDINTKKLVFGDDFSQNSIYRIEIGYGMGSVDYIYIKYDIDNVPEIVSCIHVNWGVGDQFEYSLLDKEENIIEHQIFTKEKNETSFEQKMEEIFEAVQKKALKHANS